MVRARIGVALGVVLALVVGGVAAHAVWAVRAPIPVAAVATGDLTVAVRWQPTPVWGTLLPGATTPPSTLVVTANGAGQTLRWRLRLSRAVAAEFEPHVTLQAWVGACGTGTPLTAAGYSPGAGLTIGQAVSVCLQLTLAPTAPATLQGRPMGVVLTVRAEQRGS